MSAGDEGAFWDRVYADLPEDALPAAASAPSVHPVYNPGGAYSIKDRLFLSWLTSVPAASALVVGAGVDKIGILLATRGCQVVSLDLSAKAGELTRRMADAAGVGAAVRCVCGDWQQADLGQTFDLIVFRDCLHHMRLAAALDRVEPHRARGGTVLGLEPVCPMSVVRYLHQRLPFHPFPFLPSERELDRNDLARIAQALGGRFELRYFDLLTRESLSFFMWRLGWRDTIARVGQLDQWLVRHVPGLAWLASYVVFRSTRS
jgi:SAM-dependent methyltransferase